MSYYVPQGGLPPQTALTTDRARFTEAYAVIPARTLSDITTSYLPGWSGMRMWVLARPLSGFAETFSQYVVEVSPGGGSDHPRQQVLLDRLVDGLEEGLLRREVVVQRAPGHPGPLHDLLASGASEALLREQVARGGQEGGARRRPPLALGAAGPGGVTRVTRFALDAHRPP